ncbi:hypothetical protein GDO86_011684, partial [Hymenochirus boettgeri]
KASAVSVCSWIQGQHRIATSRGFTGTQNICRGNSTPLKVNQGNSGGRSALLADIHKGAQLKKVTQINDRSAPQIDDCKKNSSTGNERSCVVPPSGGLFAGGFPVLKPPGQRDAPGSKSPLLVPSGKYNNSKPANISTHTSEIPKRPTSPAPATIAMRAPLPPRPNILGPPPTPPPANKPQMVSNSQATQPFKERSANPPPLPPSLHVQGDKSPKFQRPPSLSFPPPPPPLPPSNPPPAPPTAYTGRTPDISGSSESAPWKGTEYSDAYPSFPDRDYPSFPPPPPPPPPLPMSVSNKRRSSEPFPPPPNIVTGHSDTTSRPVKSLPVPPPPPHGRNVKLTGSNGSRLLPPPPPARSPSTELSSKQQLNQQQPYKNSATQVYSIPKRGSAHDLDDFELKFTFHSVDELPPPEIFEPNKRLYPSKSVKGRQNPPPPPPMRFQMR